MTNIPTVYQEFIDDWQAHRAERLDRFQRGDCSFVPHLLPQQAVELSGSQTLEILQARLGDTLALALDATQTDPAQPPAALPAPLRGPVADQPDGEWLKRVNMVGINVRSVTNFWNVVKYSLTLPAAQQAVHLLPIWEPGVVGSMYGMSSWQLNPEFYSAELADLRPHLNSTKRQLRAVVNLLHALGRSVGMDVIPHTDRFSEMALATPAHFEWLQRQDTEIVNHQANLHERVEEVIFAFLRDQGPAVADSLLPTTVDGLFAELSEVARLRLLFGQPDDFAGRNVRRVALLRHLHRYGLEPVPGTMAPPYRGLAVNREQQITDANGLAWREYQITRPESMSRVFGPLSRYKLYERLDDNRDWAIDFSRPRTDTWRYICRRYGEVQQRFNFDFMRGDMAHVQMRPEGVPATVDDYYDPLRAIKRHIQQSAPHFAYFAETFVAPRDIMVYGEELDHLEASEAEATLGDLQSTVVGSPEFMQRFRQYTDMAVTRRCVPAFTVMTGDKDDPRFDEFYRAGNEARLFMAVFLADLPSYMGLGFEVRDVHHQPAPNEHYTKLYVFQESVGEKATYGPYVWGRNGRLYHVITRLKLYLEEVWPQIQGRATRWLLPPDPSGGNKVVAWTQQDKADYLFVVNLNLEQAITNIGLPLATPSAEPALDFSTHPATAAADRKPVHNGYHLQIGHIAAGEGRVYRLALSPD